MSEVRIETARLLLHPFALDDLNALHQLWIDQAVRKFLWDDKIISRKTAQVVIEDSQESFAECSFGFWVLSFKDDAQTVGFGGLRQFTDEQSGAEEIEILYGLLPEHWGKGLATEGAQALLRYGFEECGLAVIYAGADPPNEASFRVIERLGMNQPRYTTVNGQEAIYYVITRAEFQPAAAPYRLARA